MEWKVFAHTKALCVFIPAQVSVDVPIDCVLDIGLAHAVFSPACGAVRALGFCARVLCASGHVGKYVAELAFKARFRLQAVCNERSHVIQRVKIYMYM